MSESVASSPQSAAASGAGETRPDEKSSAASRKAAAASGGGKGSPLYMARGFYPSLPWSAHEAIAELKRLGRTADAAIITKVGYSNIGRWISGLENDRKEVRELIHGNGAEQPGSIAKQQMPMAVLYNIPNRDCAGLSGGGASSPDAYRQWLNGISQEIGSAKVAVVVEPDASSVTNCLSAAQQSERWGLIRYAITTLRAKNKNAVVYIGSEACFGDVPLMVSRIKTSGVREAHGLALNVAQYHATKDVVAYAQTLRSKLGYDLHVIIDTSSNGSGMYRDGKNGTTWCHKPGDNATWPCADGGSDAEWCNPPGRTFGSKATTNTGISWVDAFVWVTDGGTQMACQGPQSQPNWYDYVLEKYRRTYKS